MALEAATYINDLVITNPPGSDPKSQGDDHIKLLKNTIKASIKGWAGNVLLTGADAGAVNAYVITPTVALAAYATGMMVIFTPANTNTTTSTLNISALGAKDIKAVDGSGLTANDLVAGSYYLLVYNGTNFRIINGPTKNYADNLAFSAALPAQAGNGGKYITTDGVSASWNDVLASPTFTGVPAAPTAAVDTNTTQIATTAFVIGQGYAKLAGPTFTGNVTVPTLAADATSAYAINAAWYGGQAGTSSPLMDGVAAAGTSKKWSPIDHVHPTDTSLAPLASPTFTGTPAAPTAAEDTNTTQLATTAFVLAQAASQAQMEAASSTTQFATAGNTNWHPGVAKFWLTCDALGTINVSHNMTSITDNGAGDLTVTIATDFSSVNYPVLATPYSDVALYIFIDKDPTTQAAGAFRATCYNGAAAADPTSWYFVGFGDQA